MTEYFAHGMAELEEASAEVDALVGDQRAKNPYINHLIRSYADHKMPRVVHLLATYAARFFGRDNLSTDYRTRNVSELPEATPEILESLGRVLSYEQAVIRTAGIANPDDTVTLFRNCGERQLGRITSDGREYTGSNAESWTLRPDLDWPGKKVSSVIPIRYCLASCIGRKDRPFMHPEQCEIVVCSSFVKTVKPVEEQDAVWAKASALARIRRNLQLRLSDGDKRASLAPSNAVLKAVHNALLMLAKEVLAGRSERNGLYYGKRPIHPKCGNWAAKRRSNMTRENCDVASESFDEAWERIRKSTASLAEAASEMKRWQREHGVPNPDILSRMPTQEEIDFEMQMMRWMDFLKARGKEVGCRTQADRAEHRRLWPLFVAEELKRNPNASIPEWEN